MRTISVEPGQLESCAARMEDKNQDYLRCMQDLFAAVDMMSSAWKGKDNMTFTSQIERFETDFRQLSILCSQYSDFLRNSARAYRDTQDELTSQANALGSL